jgi:hypothetical protein
MNRLTISALLTLSTANLFAAGNAPHLEVKNKSSFTMEANVRNPFWPIGWKPAVAQSTDQHESDIPAGAFVVSSIAMQEGGRFAIINGKIMQEGQEFGLKIGGEVHRIEVRAIEDGRVILVQNGHAIVVSLTRK